MSFINLQVNLKCTIESLLRQNSKKRAMNNVVKLYDNYFNSYEETNDEGDLNEKESNDPTQFKITRMGDNKLPEWLKSENYFNEAKKLVGGIRIDMSNVKIGYKDKKVFKDLNRLITNVSNNRVKTRCH